MSDDDPFAPPRQQEPPSGDARPMSVLLAIGWTFVTTLAFVAAITMVLAARPGAKDDYVSLVGCQIVAYSLGLFLILRFHAPGASIRQFLGVRRTSFWFYPLGVLCGVALHLPLSALYTVVAERFPPSSPANVQAIYEAATFGGRAAMGMALVAIGPAIEEIFFRGAIFGPLVRGGVRRVATAVGVTAVLFAVVHVEWQQFAWIALMGVVLGALRHHSGSLVPSVLAHASFNAVSMALVAARLGDAEPPAAAIAGSAVASAALLAAVPFVARAEAARRAREEDVA